MLAMKYKDASKQDSFHLDSPQPDEIQNENQDFQLESPAPEVESGAVQNELFLPEYDPESPIDDGQLEIVGFEKPAYAVAVDGIEKPLQFHYASSLLESLEAQGVQVPYQCREGYCGGCRTDLVEGEVAYLQEPMAWINEGEILPCCCVPKSPLKLKLKG
ncbi:hypothetical protein RED65_10544 [Oceanobacter sp. RED65]|uniref:2Fe-2S ferredoxin-type domain-containing protein n=2 Tax=Bermanella marisrubri TaxID=207949 RepID=Q1N5W7_9GAMM|nr:hypothetical protein RED65_10544 [Oceanobacter sp. RED65] [Bermanella marisrubri]